jgi:AcrR family transcriptional regulator
MARKSTKLHDRRTVFTKNLIRETYLKLTDEQPADKVTVTAICKRAEINRGTFYLHYDNPMAVLHEIEDEVYEQIIEFIDNSLADENNRQNLSNTLLEVFFSDKKFTFASSPRLIEKTCTYAEQLMTDICVATGQLNETEAELFSAFVVNACFAVVKRWHERGSENFKHESVYVNKMIKAVYSVAVDPYAINEAFKNRR